MTQNKLYLQPADNGGFFIACSKGVLTLARRLKINRTIPDLHLVAIIITFFLSLVCLVLYFFAPADKAPQFMVVISLLIGHLTGKLSNAFGKPIAPLTKEDEEKPE